ncbi:MAG: N-sulfoglucosamine sulfohydrolase [Saprospiraceae bacterium]|jgi:N-sulfoglucosamine sulfohydrolase
MIAKNQCRSVLLIIATIIFGSCQQKFQKAKSPNILFAIADDASWKHFGAYGCNWVNTPAFDRVAREGLLFAKAYTPNAKCAPSRSCILTGRNSWQLEEAVNHSPYFPEKFKTYAEALGENDYWVGSVAKGWAPGDAGSANGKKRELTGPKFDKHKLTPPSNKISKNDYSRNFADFLQQKPSDKPFCFWYGSTEPHRAYEYQSGQNYGGKKVGDVTGVPAFWPDTDSIRHDMLDYAFEIEYFDGHLQNMLDQLEEAGELDNTIVIVTADNGMPFPRIKGQVYEYSNHLPLAIMWGKGIKNPGRVISDYVNFIDFTPTFLEVAGLTDQSAGMQPTTGTSLTDIFYSEKSGSVSEERDFVLVGKERHDVGRPDDQGYPVRGIIKDDFLYLRNFKPERWPKGNPETGYLNCDGSPTKTYILNTRRVKGDDKYWQLNFGKRVAEEFYNIVEDPFCMNNLAKNSEFTILKSTMEAEMIEKLSAQNDPRILGNGDVFDNYRYSGKVADFYNRYMAGEKIPTFWVNESDYEKLDILKD